MHALVIYDDLSKHSIAYRQIFLLLKLPPRCNFFPDDLFYLYTKLFERTAKLSENYGSGSLTALSIIETQSGDAATDISGKIIPIADGLILLDTELFNKNIRPAINFEASVSRLGSTVQLKATKQVANSIKMILAQIKGQQVFARDNLDTGNFEQKLFKRGMVLTELLKQKQYVPMTLVDQIVVLFAGTEGFLDSIDLKNIANFEKELIEFISSNKKSLLDAIKNTKALDNNIKNELKSTIGDVAKKYL